MSLTCLIRSRRRKRRRISGSGNGHASGTGDGRGRSRTQSRARARTRPMARPRPRPLRSYLSQALGVCTGRAMAARLERRRKLATWANLKGISDAALSAVAEHLVENRPRLHLAKNDWESAAGFVARQHAVRSPAEDGAITQTRLWTT